MAPVHEPANSRKDEALPAVEAEELDDVVYPPHELWGEGYLQEFQREHDVFSDLLRDEGIDVVMLTDLLDEDQAGIAETLPSMVYARDVCMVSKLGAHSLRMTYAAGQVEPFLVEKAMEKLSVPVAQRITPPALVEGGDFVWLNEETAMMGFITRSNEAGVNMVREKLMGGGAVKEFVAVPLPSFRVHLDGAVMVMSPDIALFHEASLGLNYRITDIMSAIGLKQLAELDDYLAKRRKIGKTLREALAKIEGVKPQKVTPGANPSYSYFSVAINPESIKCSRDDFVKALQAENIECGIHYPAPLTKQPAIIDTMKPEPCPVSEEVSRNILSLPMHPYLTDEEVNWIIEAVEKVTSHYHK